MRSRFFAAVTFVAVAAGAIALPASAAKKMPPRRVAVDAACMRLDAIAEDAQRDYLLRSEALAAYYREQQTALFETRERLSSVRESNRAKTDTYRSAQFKALERSSRSEVERAAVEQFRLSVSEAVRGYRVAVDRAIAEFRSSVDVHVSSQQSRVAAARISLKREIDRALTEAKNACAGGRAIGQIRQAFRVAIRDARQRFYTEILAVERGAEGIVSLTETKRETVTVAQEGFRASIERARAEFIEAVSR